MSCSLKRSQPMICQRGQIYTDCCFNTNFFSDNFPSSLMQKKIEHLPGYLLLVLFRKQQHWLKRCTSEAHPSEQQENRAILSFSATPVSSDCFDIRNLTVCGAKCTANFGFYQRVQLYLSERTGISPETVQVAIRHGSQGNARQVASVMCRNDVHISSP